MIFDNFYIMGIDPGSRTMGVCVMEMSPALEIVSIHTFSPVISRDDSTGIYDNIITRLKKLDFIIRSIYSIYKPTIVSMESSFINASRMGAVIPLTKSIGLIETVLATIDEHIKIVSIPPSVIKKVFKSKQKGKDSVTEALMAKKSIVRMLNVDRMSEHSIDAVAIAYTLLSFLKGNKGMLCIRYLQR